MIHLPKINTQNLVDSLGYTSMAGMLGYRVAEFAEDTYRLIARIPKTTPFKIPNLSPKALGVMGALAFPLIAKQAIPSAKNILRGEYTKQDIALLAGAFFAGLNLATLPFQNSSPIIRGIKIFSLIGGFAVDGYGLATAENKTDFWTQAGMLFLFNFDRQTRQAATHFISSHFNSDFVSKVAYSSALLAIPSVALASTGSDPSLLPATLITAAAVTTAASGPYRRLVKLMREIKLYEITDINCFPDLRILLRRAVRIVQHPTIDQAQKLIRDADQQLIKLVQTKFFPQLEELLTTSRILRGRMERWTTTWHDRYLVHRLTDRTNALIETLEFIKPKKVDPLLSPEIEGLTRARDNLTRFQEETEQLIVLERNLQRCRREKRTPPDSLVAQLQHARSSAFAGIRAQANYLFQQLPPPVQSRPVVPPKKRKADVLTRPPSVPSFPREARNQLPPKNYLMAEAKALGTNGSPRRFQERIKYWDDTDVDLACKIYERLRNRAKIRFVNLLGALPSDFSDDEAIFFVRTLGTHLDLFASPGELVCAYEGSLHSRSHSSSGIRFELEGLIQLINNPFVKVVKARGVYHADGREAEVDQHIKVTLEDGIEKDFFIEYKTGYQNNFDLRKQFTRLTRIAGRHAAAIIMVAKDGTDLPRGILEEYRIPPPLRLDQLATMTVRKFNDIWRNS